MQPFDVVLKHSYFFRSDTLAQSFMGEELEVLEVTIRLANAREKNHF